MAQINRAEASRALAKAIAYDQCGKPLDAARWLAGLVAMFGYEITEATR